MINQAYWEARALARTAVYNRSAAKVVKITAAAMNRSLSTLKGEMNDILRVFSDQYGITRADALKLLEQPVDYATQQALKAQLAQITDPNARRVFQSTINAPYYSARMTRAQALHDSIVVESTKVAEVEQSALNQHLQFAYIDGVDRFAYDVSKGFGRMLEFSEPSVKKAQEVLRHRWQGGNYSSRIWGNAKLMVKDLESALLENVLAGKTSNETWKALVQAANGEVAKAQRLIRTETAYIAGQAEKDGYKQAGFEHYKFVSRLEARTCKVCGNLDGKVFPVRDAIPGKNMEPMHPWCMCTTMPWDEEMEELMRDETRWAKDPDTGEVVQVPSSMTYQEWKEMQRISSGKVLKYEEKSSIISMPDVPVFRSVGAMGQKYMVRDLGTGEDYPIAPGTSIKNVSVFAGKGTKTPYRIAKKFAERYGGKAEDWQHVKGVATLDTDDGYREAEVHWSQCENVGRKEFFVKRWIE